MAGKYRPLSTLVEQQLPQFISDDYPMYVEFVKKYYEQLECNGQPLDIINNLSKYLDLDTYDKELFKSYTYTSSVVLDTDTTINVLDTVGFPETNGYILIDDEAIFYRSKTNTSFLECYRNVGGTTRLGDLYSKSDIKTVEYKDLGVGVAHAANTTVRNISNLFLYAFVKNFESQYLNSFPEESLKPEVDKKILLKNIKQFYKAKGTDQSIQFIFSSIVSKEPNDIPTVYYPKDFTFKSSGGEWVKTYSLKAKIISGDPYKLIGRRISQFPDLYDESVKNAFAIIDDVSSLGGQYYEIILVENTVVGQFKIASETFLTKTLNSSSSSNTPINVYSTLGWDLSRGRVFIGNEEIVYDGKKINQFNILKRGQTPQTYVVNSTSPKVPVYSASTVSGSYTENGVDREVRFLILGVLYNLASKSPAPYSADGDSVEEFGSGFTTRDPIIFDRFAGTSGDIRWKINEIFNSPNLPLNPSVNSSLSEVVADVSAIFEDSQYYYVASSGIPSHEIGLPSWTNLKDQIQLKLIKKVPEKSTEIYETPTSDVGILVNGVTVRGYKDEEDVVFGGITEMNVTNKGFGYKNAPYVIVEDKIGITEAAFGIAILSGETVDRIEIANPGSGYFPPSPTITITSGRNAVLRAVVTSGKVTSIIVANPGEYYSSAPEIRIVDKAGRGKFARFRAVVSSNGQIIECVLEDSGKFYTQDNIEVQVVPVGSGATATCEVRKWKKNRFYKISSNIDSSYGSIFANNIVDLGNSYSYIGNPKKLRITLGDNLDSIGQTTSPLQHSPILGFAYDGNPIYGPYGYQNAVNATSTVQRMSSSYFLKNSRVGGPGVDLYPLGSLIEDYEYLHRYGSLDENNGRYCVTPEYPNGTYAYFISVDSNDIPVFPYILGKNFYSLPVDSNYTKNISQDQIPKTSKRIRYGNIPNNGFASSSVITSTISGEVSNIDVQYSNNNFSVGSEVQTDYYGTGGSGISAYVDSIQGKSVESLQNYQTKTIQIQTSESCYFYDNSIVKQSSSVYGTLVGDVFDGKSLVLRNVSGTFDKNVPIYTDTKVIRVVVDNSSNYTENSTIRLKNGTNAIITSLNNNVIGLSSNPFVNGDPIIFTGAFSEIVANQQYFVVNATGSGFRVANTLNGTALTLTNATNIISSAIGEKSRGIVLEKVDDKNTVKIKVESGVFDDNQNYYLESSTLTDTVGSKIFLLSNLSSDISIFDINNNIALVKTTEDHLLSVGDEISVDINPSDISTETTYYVRRRIYQKVKLNPPTIKTKINDSGAGRIQVLNSGSYFNNGQVVGDYANGGNQTYTNVELIFLDQTKCRDEYGNIVQSAASLVFPPVIGKSGNSNNARATISTTNGAVTSVTITSKGSGYILGDILTCSPSSIGRPPSSTNTQNLKILVDHIGVSSSNTTIKLDTISNISVNDLISIEKEIVKVVSVSELDSSITVLRGYGDSVAVDHINDLEVTGLNISYRMSYPYAIGSQSSSAIIKEYDKESNILNVVYNLGLPINSISKLTGGYTFYDQSTPRKLVTVTEILEEESFKFEFSKDTNDVNYVKNPILNIQNYYSYKFDTSNATLSGSYLEFSPSVNYNILTTEVTRNTIKPGLPNSYIKVKVGYGPAISGNNYSKKVLTDFTKFYYFDKAGIVKSDKSYLSIINDPLQGQQLVSYTTPRYFAYQLSNIAAWDGSGTITYTTKSKTSVGKINSIALASSGKNFNKIPTVIGINSSPYTECLTDVLWNSESNSIISVKILSNGSSYSKPKAVIVNGDGIDAEFDVTTGTNGSIRGIIVKNSGKYYTYKPTVKIIETDVKCYYESKNIGVPNSIKVVSNGYGFFNDDTISNYCKSYDVLVLENIVSSSDSYFVSGEEIVQYESGVEISRGRITSDGYRNHSNLVKVITLSGKFKNNLPIQGLFNKTTANVKNIFVTVFDQDVRPYVDNNGKYLSEKSLLGINTQKIGDSYFYQDYSYAIKSKSQISDWRTLINETTHPAGFKVFGELSLENNSVQNDVKDIKEEIVSIIQLWDEDTNHIRVISENTRREIITNVMNVSELSIENGRGSVYAPIYDTGETTAYEFSLQEAFDGYFDQSGNRAGRTQFTMKLSSTTPLTVTNINNLFVTLDGIFQEPNKAYTVSGDQITFAESPLGYRDINGNAVLPQNYIDGVDSPPQKIIGRFIKFKDSSLNSQYFKKIKDISSQFDNVKTAFDLYYFDNTPVELSSFENLLVSIDGVIQQAGVTPVFPGDRAYYIKRTVVPNQIVFVEPPRVFENNKQSFYAYNVGAYERLEIDYRFVNGSRTGPFIIKSPLTKKSITVDEERNVMVFVDGVLQKRKKSYEIRGASITFTEPLRINQKLNLIYLYGRDYEKSLVAFNFEQVPFYNYFKIAISTVPPTFDFSGIVEGLLVYQGASPYNYSAIATLRSIQRVYGVIGTTYNLYFETAQNKPFSNSNNIIFANSKTLSPIYTLPSSDIVSIDAFNEDGDTLDILSKTSTTLNNFIKIGDQIKVDGESDYRTVLSIPSDVTKTEYRLPGDVNSGYTGRIGVTNYNGEISGEGLDVIPVVDTNIASPTYSQIIELQWNKKDWVEYFDNGIVPTGAGYGYTSYPIIQFIPQPVRDDNGIIVANQPAQGGGAEGYAITNGNEIIDVVLTNRGSGYLTPPKVYITRQYKLKRVVTTENYINLNIEPTSIFVTNLVITSAITENPQSIPQFNVVSLTTEGLVQSSATVGVQNIEIITPTNDVSIPLSENQPTVIKDIFVQPPQQLVDVDTDTSQYVYIFEKNESATSILGQSELIHQMPMGVVDTKVLTGLSSDNYTGNVLGNRWDLAKEIFFLDPGVANVSGMTIGEFADKYPNVTIDDIDQPDLNSVLLGSYPYIWDNGYPSSQEYGSNLQTSNLSAVGGTGVIVYGNTRGFPSSGIIQINKELITYTSKLTDRFVGCTRGAYSSPIGSHLIGDYMRSVSAPV